METKFETDHVFFSGKKVGNVAVLNFKENLPLHIIDLDDKEILFKYLNSVADNDDIRVLLIFGSSKKTQREEYVRFYRNLLTSRSDHLYDIDKMFNAINQIILRLSSLNKMVIHADNGNIISLFLNISLACDYRIIGDKSVFQNPNIDIGLVSKGGGVFFLYHKLGRSRTYEILLTDKDIGAQEALRLNIIDKVVPSDQIREQALEIAQDFARKPAHLLIGIKELLRYCMKDLDRYLNYENEILQKHIRGLGTIS